MRSALGPPPKFEPIQRHEFTLEVDLVLIAMGFVSAQFVGGMIEQLGVVSTRAEMSLTTNNS